MNNPIIVEGTTAFGNRKDVVLFNESDVFNYIYEELPPEVTKVLREHLNELVIKNEVLQTELNSYERSNEGLRDVLQEIMALVEMMLENPSKNYYLQDIKALIENNT